MKTITRASLNELAKVMPVLSEEEQREYVGGNITILDRMGCVIDVKESKENGIQCAADPNKKNATGAYIPLGAGILVESYSYEKIINSESGATEDRSGLRINGGSVDLFEQLARNTDVEWACSFKDKGTSGSLINTTHQAKEVEPLYQEGYDSLVHSHSDNNQESPEDETNRKELDKKRKDGKYDYKYHGIYNVEKNTTTY